MIRWSALPPGWPQPFNSSERSVIIESIEPYVPTPFAACDPGGWDADISGRDADLVHPDRWVSLGPTDQADGYSQDVQFELKGNKGVKLMFHSCNDTTLCPQYYTFVVSYNNLKFQIYKDNALKADKQKASRFRLNNFIKFKSYHLRYRI